MVASGEESQFNPDEQSLPPPERPSAIVALELFVIGGEILQRFVAFVPDARIDFLCLHCCCVKSAGSAPQCQLAPSAAEIATSSDDRCAPRRAVNPQSHVCRSECRRE